MPIVESDFEKPSESLPDLHLLASHLIKQDQAWILSLLSPALEEPAWSAESFVQGAVVTLNEEVTWPFAEQLWRVEHKVMFRYMKTNDLHAGFAQWFILSALMGADIDVTKTLPTSATLCVLGVFYTARHTYRVKQSQGKLAILLDDICVLDAWYDSQNRCWHPYHVHGKSVVLEGKRIELIAYAEDMKTWFENELPLPLQMDIDVASAAISAAAQELSSTSSRYTQWVKAGLHQIMLFHYNKDSSIKLQEVTFSSSDIPGVISFKMPFADPRLLPEALVHEVSHGYMNALQTIKPLVNNTDDQLYYSPLKGRGRPLPMIVTSYHAVLNMLGYLEDAVSTYKMGEMADFQQQRWGEYRDILTVLARPFDVTKGLTESGSLFLKSIFSTKQINKTQFD